MVTATRVDLAPLLEMAGVIPTPELLRPLEDKRKEKQVTGGVRAGKSTEGALEIWTDADFWDPDIQTLYWLIGGTYQATSEEFAYLVKWANRAGIVGQTSTTEDGVSTLVTTTNSTIETRSSQHTERIASKACRGVVVVEAGQQAEDVRDKALERVLETGGWVTYTGTVEDDEAKPRYAWYNEFAQDYSFEEGKDDEYCVSYSLPSWANAYAFPEGRADPKIIDLEARMPADVFDRRVGGKAKGVSNMVYKILREANFLLPLPEKPRWVRSVGGIDFGTSGDWQDPKADHLTVLTAITVQFPDIAWVRECYWEIDYGSASQLQTAKTHLSFKYKIPSMYWNVDPNQRYMAQNEEGTAATGTTEGRFGLVNGRLIDYRLFFDLNGLGVPELYEEMKRRHLHKNLKGVLEPVRSMDDRSASLEYAVEALDGTPWTPPPTRTTMQRPQPRRTAPNGWRPV